MNKELKLLRTQTANTNTSVPLQNVTNLLEAAANVLPSKSMPKWKTRRKVRKSQRVQTLREHVAVESLILSMPIIRPEKENQKTGQKKKKSK